MMRWLVALGLWLPAVALAGPNTVAVLYFENKGNPELEPLKVGLAQMLVSDLTGTPGLTVVERSRLQALLDEQDLGRSGRVDATTAAQIGKLLGAEWFVWGTYVEVAGTFVLSGQLTDVDTGQILLAPTVTGKATDFVALEQQLAAKLRDDLAARVGGGTRSAPSGQAAPVAAPPAATATAVVAADPDELAAALAFSEGLVHLDKKDVTRARESFEKALATDPQLAAARAELDKLKL